MSSRWTIGKKLVVSFLGVAAITLVVGVMGFYGLVQLESALYNIGRNRIPDLQDLSTLNTQRMAIRAQTLDVWIPENLPHRDQVAYFRNIQQQRLRSWAVVDESFDRLANRPRQSQRGRDLIQRLEGQYRAWRTAYVALDGIIADMASSLNSDEVADLYVRYTDAMERMIPVSDAMGATFDELTTNNTTNTNQLIESNISLAHTLEWVSAIAVLLGVALALALGLLMSKSINTALKLVISDLSSGAEQVAAAAEQLSSSSQQVSQGASEQAASLEEVSSSVEELSAMTKQNAQNSQEANLMGKSANSAGEKGILAVKNMGQTVNEIKTSSDKTALIIKTIDEIAMQTNLLALNAAVEAARAGDAGRGFAVVAEEVRNLAQRSAEAAKSTAELIEGMQKSSENGVAASVDVEASIDDIVGTVAKMTSLLTEVSAASAEQAEGLGQINSAITQLDQVTQSSAANAEESASSSEELSAQAQTLSAVVARLSAMVGGGDDTYTSIKRPQHRPTQSERRIQRPTISSSNIAQKRRAEISPSSVIPFEDDEDLQSF